MRPETVEKFYANVRFPEAKEGCWNWGKSTSKWYGHFRYKGKVVSAHRMAWRIQHGEWPTKLVLHHCDNVKCIRPSHLFQGTQKDNIEDMIQKGRRGVGNTRIPDAVILRIRKLKGKVSQYVLAEIVGVSQVHISRIQREESRVR